MTNNSKKIGPYSLIISDRTETGKVRGHNEDNKVILGETLLVYDGMGGHAAGEVASAKGVEAGYAHYIERRDRDAGFPNNDEARDILEEIVNDTKGRIESHVKEEGTGLGMGTTIVGQVYTNDGNVIFGHAGDSRAYRYRNKSLTQITKDHSPYNQYLENLYEKYGIGANHDSFNDDEKRKLKRIKKKQSNVITNAILQGDDSTDLEITGPLKVEIGDLYLLCSDGLTDMVSEETIQRIISEKLNRYSDNITRSTIEELNENLIEEANSAGGSDNITVILSYVEDIVLNTIAEEMTYSELEKFVEESEKREIRLNEEIQNLENKVRTLSEELKGLNKKANNDLTNNDLRSLKTQILSYKNNIKAAAQYIESLERTLAHNMNEKISAQEALKRTQDVLLATVDAAAEEKARARMEAIKVKERARDSEREAGYLRNENARLSKDAMASDAVLNAFDRLKMKYGTSGLIAGATIGAIAAGLAVYTLIDRNQDPIIVQAEPEFIERILELPVREERIRLGNLQQDLINNVACKDIGDKFTQDELMLAESSIKLWCPELLE